MRIILVGGPSDGLEVETQNDSFTYQVTIPKTNIPVQKYLESPDPTEHIEYKILRYKYTGTYNKDNRHIFKLET